MSGKKFLGILFALVGIVCIYTSTYIKSEVEEGKGKIRRGEAQVKQSKQLFKLSPTTEPVGEILTSSAQSQINQGKRDVAYYEQLSYWLLAIGVVFIIIGALLFFSKKKS